MKLVVAAVLLVCMSGCTYRTYKDVYYSQTLGFYEEDGTYATKVWCNDPSICKEEAQLICPNGFKIHDMSENIQKMTIICLRGRHPKSTPVEWDENVHPSCHAGTC